MFQTIDSFDTEFSADSVEWCPAENFKNIFVCGTYQLTSKDNNSGLSTSKENEGKKRVGRIYLFQVIKNDKLELRLLQQVDVVAILDMKWAHIKCWNGRILLGIVNAEGLLQIYELVQDKIFLKFVSEILVGDIDSPLLALSLDWSTGKGNQCHDSEIKITVSDSKGSISLFKLCEDKNGIQKVKSWHAHGFEAWIAAFDYWNTNIIYTGGDDCKFLRFDSRIDTSSPTGTNKSHNAGVTSLHSSWKNEFHLVSGSYDETLRTWDARNFRRPVAEVNVGGGIWRLKWDPYESKYLLAACMYNGFFVVDCANVENPEVIAEYKEHESIAYGCDWSYLNDEKLLEENTALVGTCSFYDHLLKLSVIKFEELKTL